MPYSDLWANSPSSESHLADDREMFAFDVDDPDFHHDPVLVDHLNLRTSRTELNEVLQLVYHQGIPGLRKVKTSPMALSSLQSYPKLDLLQCDLYSQSHKSHSVESLNQDPEPSMYDYSEINIEDLRSQMNSCLTCGVSWQDDHVSLDCQECGGYSMERPCPACDGKCGSTWKRDMASSHSLSKATWSGTCNLHSGPSDSTEVLGSDYLSRRFQSLHAS